jgi:excisionase family DNA binding protein
MADEEHFLEIPGHVSTKKAAKMLGISYNRLYDYVRAKRLPSTRVGHMLMVPIEAIEQFKLSPPGRVRKQPPAWRVYNSRSRMLKTDIQVQVRPNQQSKLIQKLKAIYKGKRHLFSGSIQRYIMKDMASPSTIEITLVWKDTEMPDEATRRRELESFKAELDDVLDWETAQYSDKEGIIYT